MSLWGEGGDGDGQFNRPAGIAVDADGNAIVVDSLNHRVQKFTKDGGFLSNWGGFGSGEGSSTRPGASVSTIGTTSTSPITRTTERRNSHPTAST